MNYSRTASLRWRFCLIPLALVGAFYVNKNYPLVPQARGLTETEFRYFLNHSTPSIPTTLQVDECAMLDLGPVCKTHYLVSLELRTHAATLNVSTPLEVVEAEKSLKQLGTPPTDSVPAKILDTPEGGTVDGSYRGPRLAFKYDATKTAETVAKMRTPFRSEYAACLEDFRTKYVQTRPIPLLRTLLADSYRARAQCMHVAVERVIGMNEFSPGHTENSST